MYRIFFLVIYFLLFSAIPSFGETIKNDFGYWNKANINIPVSDRLKLNLDTQYKYQKQDDGLGNSFVR